MKKRTVIVLVSLFVVFVIVGYNYLYKDHRDISEEEPVEVLTAVRISERFTSGNSGLLLNNTVTVSGVVTEIEGNSLVLDKLVSCSFSELPQVNLHEIIVVKGRCVGYDELFEVVKLDQCLILK